MNLDELPLIDDELDLLDSLVPLAAARLVEAVCGAARLSRELLRRHAGAAVTALEVDDRQHAKNLADPADRLHFIRAAAEAMTLPACGFDGALMLKSLHHVPVPRMGAALAELARVLRPGGWLYVSEPVYAGPLNELIRPFNDEREVRAAAQRALDRAIESGGWSAVAERHFAVPVQFRDFAEFEQRMMRPTFADHGIDAAMVERVRALYAPHQRSDGARFRMPMHVRLLRRL